MVPHLITALTGPINELEARILESMPVIERWFRLEWMEHTPPFYTSVDIRNAGFKLAPVDTNLYPGGFNNLTPQMLPLAVQAAMASIEKICPEAKNLLLIPEKHTRNTFYLANVQTLMRIFTQAGLNVRLGTLDETITAPTTLQTADGGTLVVEPLVRKNGRVMLKDFDPCTILLNNDLSSGTPNILKNMEQQYLLPPLHAGWSVRRKSKHFAAYEEVAKKFAKVLGMDHWLINPMYEQCGTVNFAEGTGIDCVKTHADAVLTKIRRKYKDYGINEKPFVIVKADNGTYGMGIMTVRDVKELDELNRRTKNKMAVVKDGQQVNEVIIQEGVPTYERINEGVAEPVVYMMDRYVVGGFYRVHADRGIDENLNAPGASFVPLAFADPGHLPKPGEKPG
ncbi:MAG: glutamate--cysteine ligase, partial [Inhella sp.]